MRQAKLDIRSSRSQRTGPEQAAVASARSGRDVLVHASVQLCAGAFCLVSCRIVTGDGMASWNALSEGSTVQTFALNLYSQPPV